MTRQKRLIIRKQATRKHSLLDIAKTSSDNIFKGKTVFQSIEDADSVYVLTKLQALLGPDLTCAKTAISIYQFLCVF
jgi:hypothetical protein